MADAPPPPPPHGAKSSPLPNGNYDIFIIPPHSSGSGFLYLPSLKPNVNSFVAGFFTALLAVGLYNILVPALSQTIASLNSGIGLFLCLAAVGAAFSFGRTVAESSTSSKPFPDPGPSAGPNFTYPSASSAPPPPPPNPGAAPRFTTPPKPNNTAQSEWEKAKEQTRKREEDRRKAEELKARQAEAAKKKEEAEKAAKAAAEKEKWEQQRAREKDTRERLARERIAKERLERENAAKAGAAGAGGAAAAAAAGAKKYEKPTAQSATDSDYFTQYKPPGSSVASSVSGASESSYAASMSTARTTPPPRDRGPYKTSDPNKVVLMGVYAFTKEFGLQPTSMLESNQGGVTDGLILRITTEGLFIDDDVRGVPQREWDVKAWGIKLLEIGKIDDINIFRATMRDLEGKKYFFVLPADQGWKVDTGLQRLRKGSQARSLGLSTMNDKEAKSLLMSLGWK
ncbi:hypothetical protein C1H76_3302 [Elsinoe australis]|uniref:Uncharacterized protein n=1 Tax=Elsinoe australis TaxID=40998 RepID=A0A4V6DVN9_9PEZI|nr:hypothetical protein C1H76_3302 [Elsinoe australis]